MNMWTRRKWMGSAVGASLLPLIGAGCKQEPESPEKKQGGASGFRPDIEIKLVAERGEAAIWNGKKTPVLQFRGEVLHGRKDALRESGGYLGPTLDFVRGEQVRIRFENKLDEPTIVHWHGMIVPEAADGHPQLAIKPGESYTYEFKVINRAGTYWYHPHPHGRTGFQVYHGLGGALIVRAPAEKPIGLPAGADEHLLVIQDRRADDENRFQYVAKMSNRMMMDRMMGILGDRVLVNGQAYKTIKVARRPNRLRLLNLSNARLYKLAWSDGLPMHVIGTDGGLLSGEEGPRKVPFVVLGPAERVEVWKDFSTHKAGSEVKLISEEYSLLMGMGMGGNRRMMKMGPDNGGGLGEKLTIAKFQINDDAATPGELPKLPGQKPKLAKVTREIKTTLSFRMMRGFLNGKQWDMKDMTHVGPDETLKLNESVIWTFDNSSAPGMLMPHPIHLHGVQFRILERNGGGGDDLVKGVLDTGDNDTVMVFAGDVVKIQVTPTVPGLFVYHCHNLEHEDAGMMRNFRVT